MFLIRTAFWLAVVVLFLPTSQTAEPGSENGPPAAQLSMWEAVGAARVTASDMAGFCNRNIEVCETGNTAWRVFRSKARYGAETVYGWFAGEDPAFNNPNSGNTGARTLEASQPDIDNNQPIPLVKPTILQNTLTSRDLAAPWQGPEPGRV